MLVVRVLLQILHDRAHRIAARLQWIGQHFYLLEDPVQDHLQPQPLHIAQKDNAYADARCRVYPDASLLPSPAGRRVGVRYVDVSKDSVTRVSNASISIGLPNR